jgi:hypothetical protein
MNSKSAWLSQNKIKIKGWGISQVVKHLPGNCEVINSISSNDCKIEAKEGMVSEEISH